MTEQTTEYTEQEIQRLAPLWIDVHDIFTLTGLGRFKLQELIEKDRFPKPIKLGKKVVRWSIADVTAWINKMEQTKGFNDDNDDDSDN